MAFREGQILRKPKKIIRRYMEETAQSFHIFQAGLMFPIFQIGNLTLRHIDLQAQFALTEFSFFPKQAYLFAEGHLHKYITADNLP